MSTLTVTIIQTNLHWENKEMNLRMLEEKIKSIREKTELVLLPEMFNTGFSMHPAQLSETMEGTTVQWMRRITKERNIILAGSAIIEEDGKFFNRLIWMMPNGQFGIYDKRHRFGFGGEDEEFAAGSKRLIASVKGWKINLLVCYDLRFPVWARQQPEEGEWEYDVVIYVANWPERRIHAWRTLLQARAIENQCYAIGVNRVGDDGNSIHYNGSSTIIDPLGEILYEKKEQEDVFTFTLNKERLDEVRNKFPFWRDADSFQIINE